MIFCELFFTKLHICSAAIMTIGGKMHKYGANYALSLIKC